MDLRIEELTDLLLTHSISLHHGEKVYIEVKGSGADELVLSLIRKIYAKGGIPFVHIFDLNFRREILMHCTEEQIRVMSDIALSEMKQMDCYIGIRSSPNFSIFSDVPKNNLSLFSELYDRPVHIEERVNNTKWVIFEFPSDAFAQSAGMSTPQFQDFYFNACIINYPKLRNRMSPLIILMNNTDKVRITGPGTDLSFSIKGINSVPCFGERNIPDGEVYTAPVKDSVEGYITYNTPSLYNGFVFENIHFEFSKGKIIKATSNNTEALNKILDTDEGARYIGEFSFGLNPFITFPMKNTLFDEKISGSFHLTPGHCYEKSAPNGNYSSIHWDLVSIQTPNYGGGNIYFDDILIRENGLFVHQDLIKLNPENLIK